MAMAGFKRSGTYLENYLESVSSLPADLRRNFALMRELDLRSEELLEKIQKQSKEVSSAKKGREEEKTELIEETKSYFKQCLEYADEKVSLALQTYELVDKHIRRLDQDLKKFEAELEQQAGSPPVESGKVKTQRANARVAAPAPAEVHTAPKSNVRKKEKEKEKDRLPVDLNSKDARVLNVDLDMPIDPNEPTYCICSRVSFGEMVGCDNPECKIEWFHFECVGLTNPPKGKWFCPDCRAIHRKRSLQ